MYGWLWNRLPPPRWAKIAIVVALVPAIVIALFQWGFPWAEPLFPFGHNTVGD